MHTDSHTGSRADSRERSGSALNPTQCKPSSTHRTQKIAVTHSNLNIRKGLAGREGGRRELRVGRDGDDIRAVDEVARVLAEDRQLGHHRFELRNHGAVVRCADLEVLCQTEVQGRVTGELTDERLPLAGRARIPGKLAVREETEFTGERREDLAWVGTVPREKHALQKSLYAIQPINTTVQSSPVFEY